MQTAGEDMSRVPMY